MVVSASSGTSQASFHEAIRRANSTRVRALRSSNQLPAPLLLILKETVV